MQQIKEKFFGARFSFAISPHKNVLHIYINSEDKTFRLVFSTNAEETALFSDNYRPPKKRNVLSFFDGLKNKCLVDSQLADKDRLISLQFEGDKSLIFKLFGNNPNVFMANGDTIIDAFKNPESWKGKPAPEPQAAQMDQKISPERSAKNQMTEINPLLPRNLLPYIARQHNVDEMNSDEVSAFTHRLSRALLDYPTPRVLETGELCLWSKKWLGKTDAATFDNVNEAVAYAYKEAVHLRRLNNKKSKLLDVLQDTITQKKHLIDKLRKAGEHLTRADKYEKYANILMAHAHESLPPESKKITLDDIYEEGSKAEIPVKPGRDIPQNADYYYNKARDAKKYYKKTTRRLPDEEQKLEQAEALLREAKSITHLPELSRWIKDHKKKLKQLGYGPKKQHQASSPFRKFKEGKYEIWVGKNAKSNDKLTTRAHKEDIWLHARGVGGSHTVIRMGNEQGYPPQEVLLKAAGYAAYFSKARGTKVAPVIYVKRKYVYKPSGADPGTVALNRENVEMVPPTKPEQT